MSPHGLPFLSFRVVFVRKANTNKHSKFPNHHFGPLIVISIQKM